MARARAPASTPRVQVRELAVVPPYRLDLTVSALRRLSTNLVDLFTADGTYVRALPGFRSPLIARVRQPHATALRVELDAAGPDDVPRALAMLRRILGVECDLAPFDRAARGVPWLRALVVRMRGVKPPRYPTLWEACVNAILFQQVSLIAASAIARRFVLALHGRAAPAPMTPLVVPGPARLRGTADDVLRAAGLSAGKLATLRRVAEALEAGVLADAALEALPSPDAAARLRAIKGIGPWTATLILLRGLGRLDVFPMNDSSVAQNLAFVAGEQRVEVAALLETLGPQRGMLYYCLLLARLEARGELGRPSAP